MKKRSILITAISLVLVAALSIGGTMAYFTATSGPKNNVFTVGNISIELNEPAWDAPGGSDIATNMAPGTIAKKNPSIKNTSLTNPCYARFLITGLIVDDEGILAGTGGYSIDGLNPTDWAFEASGSNVYAYYKHILPANTSTSVLFNGIKMNGNVVQGRVNGLTITLTAQAIQCQGDLKPAAASGIPTITEIKDAFTKF